MEEFTTDKSPTSTKHYAGKRPPGLTFLCILTFAGSGLSAFSSFFVSAAYDIIPSVVHDSAFAEASAIAEMIKAAGPVFFLFMGLLYAASLTGAILMFKLKKTGFHFYTLAQLLMLLLPSLMIDGYIAPISNLLLTGSFILAYAVNLKFMQ
ncbi:MAG: hypothetical protein H6541_01895 [Lentimicrobiaceae bacterium]|nr:hypothetical protein [Lentimicrobiaceae bacterium]